MLILGCSGVVTGCLVFGCVWRIPLFLDAWMYYICDVQETTLPPWQKELPYACAEVLQWVCPLAIWLVSCGAGIHSGVDVVSP